MKMRSLLCMSLASIIMLPSASMAVFAQQLEDNSTTGAVADLIAASSADSSAIVSISAGYNMSSAVRADGSVWTWGGSEAILAVSDNTFSGLADGAYNNAPKMVISKDTKSAKCSQYYNYEITHHSSPSSYYVNTAFLREDNSFWMYGGNERGALGNGDTNGSIIKHPTKLLENVVDFDVAGYRSAAVTADGKLYMWGYNRFGQIGNGTTDTAYSPVEVLSDVVSVSLGGGYEHGSSGNGHSAAIKSDGSLWMWGCNKYGQLGNGTTVDSHVPIRITDNVKQVSLGESFTVVLKKDGTVWTCGNNSSGQLAKGSLQSYQTDKETHWSNGATYIDNMWPTNVPENDKVLKKVVDLEDEVVVSIDAGYDNAGAVTSDGKLYMWGNNSGVSWGNPNFSKIGNGSTSAQPEPIIILRDVKMVSVGYSHSVALKNDNSLWSWGTNYYGQLGDCTKIGSSNPKEISLGNLKADFFVNGSSVNGNGRASLNLNWDDVYLNQSPGFYNRQLAIDGIVLSEASYSNSSVLNQFGFRIVDDGRSNDSVDKPGYLIGYKVMYDYDEPRIEIIMAIRGTKSLLSADALTDAKSIGDGFDGPTNCCYDRLKAARSTIASRLGEMGLSSAKKNTKYFLVGHSLGGACAGKLALKMGNDGVGYPQNIYAYTFAAPNYTNLASKLDTVVDVPGVFNLVHDKDLVPLVPKEMVYFWPLAYSLYKAGQTFSLSTNDNSSTFNTVIKTLYNGEIPWDTYMTYKAHMTSTYLALIIASTQNTAIDYTTKGFRIITVHCPVDIEVYDSDNELCAASSGETVIYPKPSAVRITVIGDEKLVELPDDSFTVKYIGTDTGSMKIEDQRRNTVTNEIEQEKTFNDVVLESGKLFASEIDAVDDTENTKLYVIDDEGDKTHSVDNNGKETKLALYELDPQKVHVTAADQQYDGTEKTAKVTVDGLTEGEDYRVIYKNNIEVGTASVSVKGINLYEGRVTETFDIYDNGDLGEDIQWSLSADGTLILDGRGSINDFGTDSENTAPWNKHAAGITKIVLGEGIETIGNYAFSDITELTEAHIPSTVTAISESAFLGSENVVIYGSSDSYAVAYAKEQGLSYVCADIPVFVLGDTDGNNNVTITDATMIQKYLAEYDVSETFIIEAADTDGDGRITISDVTVIQRYLAEIDVPEGIGKVIV